jgi:DNA-binding CsgD family transcriptional regulator
MAYKKIYTYEELITKPSHIYKDKIDALAKILKEKYGITFFYYQRRLHGLTCLHIVFDRKWQLRYATEYWPFDTFEEPDGVKNPVFLWGTEYHSGKEKIMHEERIQVFGIPPGVTFIRPAYPFVDTFSYSSSLFNYSVEQILKMQSKLLEWENFFMKELEFIFLEEKVTSETYKRNLNLKFNEKAILTEKEKKIIELLANDYSTSRIASKVFVTEKSVQKIIDRCKEKLCCETRTGLVAKSIRNSLIFLKIT